MDGHFRQAINAMILVPRGLSLVVQILIYMVQSVPYCNRLSSKPSRALRHAPRHGFRCRFRRERGPNFRCPLRLDLVMILGGTKTRGSLFLFGDANTGPTTSPVLQPQALFVLPQHGRCGRCQFTGYKVSVTWRGTHRGPTPYRAPSKVTNGTTDVRATTGSNSVFRKLTGRFDC